MLENFNIEIKRIRNSRKITLRLLPNQTIKVSAPFQTSHLEIKQMIESKSKWILEKYKILEIETNNHKKVEFKNSEILPFYGKKIELKITEGAFATHINAGYLVVGVPTGKSDKNKYIRNAVIKWYQLQALALINERVTYYTSMVDVDVNSVSIKNYKSRWGACSSKKHLIFNWQIVTFDEMYFNYVVAHEVCHLLEMNHSAKFYNHLKNLGFNKKTVHKEMRYFKNIF